MKKIFLLTLVALVVAGAQAQTLQNVTFQNPPPSRLKAGNINFHTPKSHTRSTGSRWLNYANDLDSCYLQLAPSTVIIPIFPDSTIITGWDNATADTFHAFYHAAATMIDPTNMPCHWLVPGNHYTLDSTLIQYGYVRTTNPSIVDTLVVNLLKQNNNVYGFADGFSFQALFFDSVNKVVKPNQILQTYRIPLTENDSTTYDAATGNINLTSIGFPTPYASFSANARIGAEIEFHPGYSWDQTPPYSDSLFNKNSFWLLSYESYGQGSATPPSDTIYSLNVSQILPRDVYYNQTGASWDGFFIPTWAYTDPFRPEHHAIWFKLVSDNLGVNDIENGFAIIGTHPNPSNEMTTLGIVLANTAQNVMVDVSDILGRHLTGTNLGTLPAGPHEIKLNTALLANGVYNCIVTSGSKSTTTKMVVAH